MLNYLILHHSATFQKSTSLDAIRKYHLKLYGRTFYNIMIDKDGVVHKEHELWNFRGKNKRSKDICIVGNFTSEVPTKEQLNSLTLELSNLYAQFSFENTIGHRDVYNLQLMGTKSLCPGKLEEYLAVYKKVL